jgi:hypothetical protein
MLSNGKLKREKRNSSHRESGVKEANALRVLCEVFKYPVETERHSLWMNPLMGPTPIPANTHLQCESEFSVAMTQGG